MFFNVSFIQKCFTFGHSTQDYAHQNNDSHTGIFKLRTAHPLLSGRLVLASWILLGIVGLCRAQDATPVLVISPEKELQPPQRFFSGTITSKRRSSLSPRISGLIHTAAADVGYVAQAGDLLVALDTTLAEFEKEQARARLNEARLQLAELERLRKEGASLLGKHAISATDVQTREAQARIQAAVVARLEIELALFRERVERHKVVAPFDGVVVAKLGEVGAQAVGSTEFLSACWWSRSASGAACPKV